MDYRWGKFSDCIFNRFIYLLWKNRTSVHKEKGKKLTVKVGFYHAEKQTKSKIDADERFTPAAVAGVSKDDCYGLWLELMTKNIPEILSGRTVHISSVA